MSFSLPTQEDKAEYVLHQFDRIARRYDLANDVISLGMHRLWKERAVTELCLQSGGSYLDVCCGTGDLSLVIARRLGSQGKVVGLDFSGNMLDVARRRSEKSGNSNLSGLELLKGDAQNLPFEDNSFDGAVISFGLRNLTDLQRGICEMARVVKPGGWVVNLDLGRSQLPLFAPVFSLYFSKVVPVLGDLIQSDRQAYTYLPASLASYPDPSGISDIFQRANLTSVAHIPLALGTVALHKGKVAQE